MPLFMAVLASLLAAGLVWNRGNDSQIIGAGSTLAAPLVERSVADYRNAMTADNPDRPQQTGGDWVLDGSGGIDYEPVGSMGGIMRLDDPEVDFAVSDYPLSSQAVEQKKVGQFPVAVGALALVHNLDLAQPLKLDAATVSAIYRGEITRWNDPALTALNPGVQLPDEDITPVHRSDGSGSTQGLTRWLAAEDAAWKSGPGTGPQISWPEGVGRAAERSGGVIEAVQQTKGALGYVEPGQARVADLELATLRNGAGDFVEANAGGMSAAVKGMDWDGAEHFTALAPSRDAKGAYPLTMPIFAVMKTDPQYATDAARTLAYLRWLVTSYDASATNLGYLPLPQEGAAAVEDYWRANFDHAL